MTTLGALKDRIIGGRRVPVFRQLSAVECGAACLAMILSYHGRATGVSECRDSCLPGRGGLTAKTVAEAARAYGLRVRAYSLEPDNFHHLSLPVVAHWNFNHFIVVERWSDLFFTQLNVSLERGRLSAVLDTTQGALRVFSPLLLLWAGAGLVLGGGLSLGSMLALNALAASFLAPIASLVMNGQQLTLVGAHMERIADVLDAEPEQARAVEHVALPLTGRVEVKGLSFQYDPHSPLALRDVSFVVEPGQKVAIVGAPVPARAH